MNPTVKALIERRSELAGKLAAAENEDERRHYDEAIAENDARIGRILESEARTAEVEAGLDDKTRRLIAVAEGRSVPSDAEALEGVALETRNFSDLAEARSTTADSRMAGEVIAAMALGRNMPEEFRDHVVGTSSKGGAAVPTGVAATILDKARSQMRVAQAGAQVIPMPTPVYKLPKLLTDPSPSWRAEASSITEGSGTFGAVTFTASSLAVLIKISLELAEDAPQVGDAVTNAVSQAMAHELDRVALYGSGSSNEPSGLTTLITPTYLGTTDGAAPSWDTFVDARVTIESNSYATPSAIMAPRTEGTLAKLKGTSNDHYLAAPQYAAEMNRYLTSAVPVNESRGTSSDCSTIFFGDFSHLLYGIRTEMKILPIREAFLSSGYVGFVAYLRADVQVDRTDAFKVVRGVKP